MDGADLIGIGYEPGPALGQALETLLAEVVGRSRPQQARDAARAGRGAPALMIRWDAPGPYVVAFTTREGGVSTGAHASLNLGSRTDDPARVAENRRLACAQLGLDPERLAVNRAAHNAALRARPGANEASRATRSGPTSRSYRSSRLPPTACRSRLPARTGPPALAVAHAGWRGLAAGSSRPPSGARRESRPRSSGRRSGRAATRSAAEVSDRFDADLTRDGMLDLWSAAERALRRAGVASVERLDLCTHCHPELFFSHRCSGPRRGAQGVIGAIAG